MSDAFSVVFSLVFFAWRTTDILLFAHAQTFSLEECHCAPGLSLRLNVERERRKEKLMAFNQP